MLIDSLSAGDLKAELDGTVATPLFNAVIHTWIRADLRRHAEPIAAALRAYRAAGHEFSDVMPHEK
ncbi:MAG: hypothetical protein VW405_10140 [Rhodospirillaceae bacterium]